MRNVIRITGRYGRKLIWPVFLLQIDKNLIAMNAYKRSGCRPFCALKTKIECHRTAGKPCYVMGWSHTIRAAAAGLSFLIIADFIRSTLAVVSPSL